MPIEFGPGQLFALFILAFVIGYLHIFIAVNFDPLEMIRQMSLPRFSQSWGRGKYGNLYSLLYELSLLIYILPPAAGLIFARAKQFSTFQKLVVSLILLLTFYYAFASGTRNVLGTYVISMFGAYALSRPDLKLKRLLIMGIPIAGVLLFASTLMLEFRSAGGVLAIASRGSPLRYTLHRSQHRKPVEPDQRVSRRSRLLGPGDTLSDHYQTHSSRPVARQA